ncbi:MAG: DUF3866 family protein [Limnochordales bacterium]|nr:DUF3866 family protein [Limnochordales bacterium]
MAFIRTRKGRVKSVKPLGPGIDELRVELDESPGTESKALLYPDLTGPARAGDVVLLNTTAVHLGLGTGGYHFVMAVAGGPDLDLAGPGHIMKLRYTPWQIRVLAAEEPDSPHHASLRDADTLEGRPVIALGLHSQLAPAALAFKMEAGAAARLAYCMTDGAALPLAFSQQVRQLREQGLLDTTVTIGHAFGGELEAVNVWSGLLAAVHAGRADAVIIGMGPGVVGTETRWGTTALEQAQLLDAIARLQGRPIAVLRLSSADPRPRHLGVSHHTLTSLGYLTYATCDVPLPVLPQEELRELIDWQLEESGISLRHRIIRLEARQVLDEAARYKLKFRSMGREATEDPLPFLAAAAAGLHAARLFKQTCG